MPRVEDRDGGTVLLAQGAQLVPIAVQVRHLAVEVGGGADKVVVVSGAGDHFAHRREDAAGQTAHGGNQVGAAGVGPVALHQAAVVHGGEEDEVGFCVDVLLAYFVKVEVKTNGAGDAAKIAFEDGRVAAAEHSALGGFVDDRKILVVEPHGVAVAVEELHGVAPAAVLHLAQRRVGDVTLVLARDAGKVVAYLGAAYLVVGLAFFGAVGR